MPGGFSPGYSASFGNAGTTLTDIVNRALQFIGTRTTVTSAELAANSSNEAIQANLVLTQNRRRLLRMAPWDCGQKTANLTYITSATGTPENTSPATTLWQPGQPRPPWAYEYQYPADCIRDCWVIPATQTGFAGGIPVTTAVTGGAPSFWQTMPIAYKVATDSFYGVTGVSIVSGGTGYVLYDYITLATTVQGNPPIGAPAVLQVTQVGAGGAILAATVIGQLSSGSPAIGGSYFSIQPNPILQSSTTGAGTGAVFNIIQGTNPTPQRVILTNQEFATLVYIQDIQDPNLMDDLFQEAYSKVLGASLTMALSGNKSLANFLITDVNRTIEEARKADSNEGLTINDVTPDWIATRGIAYNREMTGPYSGFDWGQAWPLFG